MLDEQIESWFVGLKQSINAILILKLATHLKTSTHAFSNEIEGNDVYSALSLEHAKTILNKR